MATKIDTLVGIKEGEAKLVMLAHPADCHAEFRRIAKAGGEGWEELVLVGSGRRTKFRTPAAKAPEPEAPKTKEQLLSALADLGIKASPRSSKDELLLQLAEATASKE